MTKKTTLQKLLSLGYFFKQTLFFLCALNCSLLQGYTILFVHIGNTLPAYLVEATHQARLFNPAADIVVIAEAPAIAYATDKRFANDAIRFVDCSTLPMSKTHRAFIQKTKLAGFWHKCTERFYFIDELMEQESLSDVFHMEYDIMLYVDLEKLLPAFHTYKSVAATLDNDDRCVPGFVYFAQPAAAHSLALHITNMCTTRFRDMQILALYKKTFGADAMDNLPIIMPEYKEMHPMRSSSGHTSNNELAYSNNFDLFDSIFDAAAIGQYLGGVNTIHGPAHIGFINESCLFNPALLSFSWEQDALGRKVPYATCGTTKCRINNLHIHSKRLSKFAS